MNTSLDGIVSPNFRLIRRQWKYKATGKGKITRPESTPHFAGGTSTLCQAAQLTLKSATLFSLFPVHNNTACPRNSCPQGV